MTVISGVSAISEFDPKFTIINEPDDYYGRPGDTATFIVEAEGANLSYQWLCRAPGASNFEYLTGETSSTLRVDMTSASNGAEYRCFITDANGDMGSTRIATVKLDTRDWQMEYNTSGIRTKRTSDDKTYSYIYAGDKLMRMTVGNDVLDFSYDVNGTPLTMTYNGTVYYYITNLQGDVMKLERADGGSGAQYAYDAWGNIIAIMGTLAELNPLRYRGYVYDQETGFYYLQSRYYDPAVGRFISADNFASTGQGIVGHNMFAYCNNNPAACVDGDGDIPQAVTDKLVHDAVLAMIAFEQPNLSMTQTCIYYNGENIWGGFGYCDLFNTVTGEVWELKKDSQSRSCRTSSALAQLTRYTTGKLKHHPDLQLKFPNATKINSGNFSFKAAGYIYDVSYWSENNGILRYRYTRTETNLRKTVEAIATIAVFAVMLATPYGILGAGASYMLI